MLGEICDYETACFDRDVRKLSHRYRFDERHLSVLGVYDKFQQAQESRYDSALSRILAEKTPLSAINVMSAAYHKKWEQLSGAGVSRDLVIETMKGIYRQLRRKGIKNVPDYLI